MLGLIAKKEGMTRVFTEDGKSIPVTIVSVRDNKIVDVKTEDTHGYNAVQVAFGLSRKNSISQPVAGFYKKHDIQPAEGIKEFRVSSKDLEEYKAGNDLNVDVFEEGQIVDVTGMSKGKGFAGTVKRHNFRTQDASHGNSLSHRAPGSVGQTQTPGRVWKGKKMAGRMGHQKTTIQSLQVIKVDTESSLLYIKGALPGHNTCTLIVKPSVKKSS